MLRGALAVRVHLHYRSGATLRVATCMPREPTAYATVRPSSGVFCTATAVTGTVARERVLCGGECRSRERSAPPRTGQTPRRTFAGRRLTSTPPRCLAEMCRDVPRDAVRCLAMPRERKGVCHRENER